MLKNYFKIAIRHIRKNKGFSLLNMLGLSLGLCCALLILLWINDELSYNKFNKKYDSLYQVMENHNYDGKIYTFAATPGQLASALKSEFPEVKRTTRMGWGERWLFTLKNKPVFENGNFTDPDLFKMFSFEVISGDENNLLPDKRSLVITKKMADKYFGDEEAVGQYLKINDTSEFKVTAVIKDPPLNSSIRFSWLASFKIFEEQNTWWNDWSTNGMITYVELSQGSDADIFNKKIEGYLMAKDKESSAKPLLMPMKDWRLRSNFEEGKQAGGRIEYVRLFGVIAILLILIACINFMNLATARSEQRAREVGVRKVMGAQRSGLMTQFLGESVVMSFISMFVAGVLVLLFLPSFNELVGKKLEISFQDPVLWLSLCGIALLCGILAGSYPAVFLSSFKPVSIFRGLRISKAAGVVAFRKGLVVTQFVISITLIISTVVIYKQLQHVKNRHLGFNKDKLLYLTQNGKINERLDLIEHDLLNTGVVAHAATCNQRVLQMGNNTGGFSWEGKDPSSDVLVTLEYVSPDYMNTVGMKLLAGRDFNRDATKDSNNVIINETFAKFLGKKNVLNSIIRQDSSKLTVVGVVKDFVYNDMYKKPDPVIFYCAPRSTNFYFVKLKEDVDIEAAVKTVGEVFKKDNPGYPFEYNFLDADFDFQFRSEMLISKLSRLFALITIIISCLGLFGLAAYTAERRTREIGIRKVLGASVQNLVTLLSKDFLKLVFIAIIIATPLAWYLMHQWLQDYSYRISIQWWMFLIAGAAALVIALLTVSYQAARAALTNPVKSLRTE